MVGSGSSKHVIVQRKLDQLLSWASGKDVLVQISIKVLKWKGNVLIKLRLRVFRFTFVAVNNQFVLYIQMICRTFYPTCKPMRFIIFSFFLVSFCHIIYIISNNALIFIKLNRELFINSFTKFAFYFVTFLL